MSTNIRIIHAHDFIKATPEGLFDFEKSKNLLIEVASASVSLVDYHIILDCRKMQGRLSAIDLWYLAAELSKIRQAFSIVIKKMIWTDIKRSEHPPCDLYKHPSGA
jgi:hypothetical protein